LDSTAGRALIPAWAGLPFGARLNVVNPPYQATSDPVDAFIEGKTEKFTALTWEATMNTSPALPYEVFELQTGTGNRGRWELTQTLTAAVGTGDASFQVSTPGSD